MPFNSRNRELCSFLELDLSPKQIAFKYDSDGRFSGECLLKVSKKSSIAQIKDKHMKIMGSRYIEILIADKEDFKRA